MYQILGCSSPMSALRVHGPASMDSTTHGSCSFCCLVAKSCETPSTPLSIGVCRQENGSGLPLVLYTKMSDVSSHIFSLFRDLPHRILLNLNDYSLLDHLGEIVFLVTVAFYLVPHLRDRVVFVCFDGANLSNSENT